jgi:hypothetical protein
MFHGHTEASATSGSAAGGAPDIRRWMSSSSSPARRTPGVPRRHRRAALFFFRFARFVAMPSTVTVSSDKPLCAEGARQFCR